MCAQGSADSLSIKVFIGGWGMDAVDWATMATNLKVAGAQFEAVASFQTGLLASIHAGPVSPVLCGPVNVQ